MMKRGRGNFFHTDKGAIAMTDFLLYLAYTAAFTALMWIPYILNMIMVRGLIDGVGYPDHPKPLAPWAQRMRAAHYNAVENLAVMSILALIAHAANMVTETMTTAMLAYLIFRVVHFFAYTFKVPWVRTLTFVGGWACIVVVAVRILF